MKIKVTTEQLKAAAGEAYGKIDNAESSFEDIRNVVRRSSGYWEGEGNEAYIKSYERRISTIEEALIRFRENASDLEKIAGIYEEGETENISSAEPLAMDVIV